MARRQVLCIRSKTGAPRHEYITHIGGNWGYNGAREIITEALAIGEISLNVNHYFVRDSKGDEASVRVVKHSNGKNFLTTNPDRTTDDNLSKLDECS